MKHTIFEYFYTTEVSSRDAKKVIQRKLKNHPTVSISRVQTEDEDVWSFKASAETADELYKVGRTLGASKETIDDRMTGR